MPRDYVQPSLTYDPGKIQEIIDNQQSKWNFREGYYWTHDTLYEAAAGISIFPLFNAQKSL